MQLEYRIGFINDTVKSELTDKNPDLYPIIWRDMLVVALCPDGPTARRICSLLNGDEHRKQIEAEIDSNSFTWNERRKAEINHTKEKENSDADHHSI